MVSTPYTRGRAREYQALRILRSEGWLCSRSAASHGAVDIFACKNGKMVFVQVKSGKVRIMEKDRSRLKEWVDASGGQAEIWFFGNRKGVRKEVVC
jgi:Holliday junction resolvase|tara:strand:+ start:1429 stop:1716 length:288 start_codon:yes stop_codon:yes gene_type:complete